MPKVIKEKVKLNSFIKLNFLGTRNLDGDKHMWVYWWVLSGSTSLRVLKKVILGIIRLNLLWCRNSLMKSSGPEVIFQSCSTLRERIWALIPHIDCHCQHAAPWRRDRPSARWIFSTKKQFLEGVSVYDTNTPNR